MSKREELRKLLKAYVHKTKEPTMPYPALRGLVQKYLVKYPEELKELSFIREEIDSHLPSLLSELEQEGILALINNPDGSQTVRYDEFYLISIEQRYKAILDKPDTPLPSEQSFSILFPPDIIHPVDVKVDFLTYIEEPESAPPKILRVMVPDVSKSLLVITPLLKKELLDIALQKVRLYLRNQKNSTYIQHKLVPLFRGKERILKDQIMNVVTKPDLTLQDFYNPSDFVFQFWSQACSFLIKELSEKKEKLEEENDLVISAHLIGAYSIFFKGRITKEKESEAALKTLSGFFEKAPYAYTFHDIYHLRDSRGFPLIKKIDNASLQQFLDSKTTPPDPKALPEIIKVRSIDKKEYFIHKNLVARLLLEKSFVLFRTIRERIAQDWYEALEREEKRKEWKDPQAFDEYATKVLKELDPLFYSLLNFSLLFLILEQVKPSTMEKEFLESVIDRKGKKIQPVSTIFHLYPDDLLSKAKLKLPLWKTIPIVKHIVKFFLKMLSTNYVPKKGKNESAGSGPERKESTITLGRTEEEAPSPAPSSASERERKAQFRKAIETLREKYVGSNEDLKAALADLIEEWNTILDPKAKQNLVEDVNSLVRDFLRKLKIPQRLAAPNAEKLEKLAEQLIAHEALNKIKKKAPLRRYLILYMLDVLGKVR